MQRIFNWIFDLNQTEHICFCLQWDTNSRDMKFTPGSTHNLIRSQYITFINSNIIHVYFPVIKKFLYIKLVILEYVF